MLIGGAVAVIVVVVLAYLMRPAGTDVVGSNSSIYGTLDELTRRSNLFPPLDKLTVSEFVSDTFPHGRILES